MQAVSKAKDTEVSGIGEFPTRKNRSQETYNRVGEIIGITKEQ